MNDTAYRALANTLLAANVRSLRCGPSCTPADKRCLTPLVRRVASIVLAVVFSAALAIPSHPVEAAGWTPWVSGFYAGWMANSYPPSAIDYAALTHVMMFSVLPNSDGTLDTSFFGAGAGVAVEVAQRAHTAAQEGSAGGRRGRL